MFRWLLALFLIGAAAQQPRKKCYNTQPQQEPIRLPPRPRSPLPIQDPPRRKCYQREPQAAPITLPPRPQPPAEVRQAYVPPPPQQPSTRRLCYRREEQERRVFIPPRPQPPVPRPLPLRQSAPCIATGSFIGNEYWTTIGYDGTIRDDRTRGDFLIFDQHDGYIAYWITRSKYGSTHYEAFGHAFVRPDNRICAWFVGLEKEIVEVCGGFRVLSRSRYNPLEPVPFEWVLATPTVIPQDTLGFHDHRIARYSWDGETFYGDARVRVKNFQGVNPVTENYVDVTEPFDFERKVWLLKRKDHVVQSPPRDPQPIYDPSDRTVIKYADPHTQEDRIAYIPRGYRNEPRTYEPKREEPVDQPRPAPEYPRTYERPEEKPTAYRPQEVHSRQDPRYYNPKFWYDRRNWKLIDGKWHYDPRDYQYWTDSYPETSRRVEEPRNYERQVEAAPVRSRENRDPRYYDPKFWYDKRNWKYSGDKWIYDPGNYQYWVENPEGNGQRKPQTTYYTDPYGRELPITSRKEPEPEKQEGSGPQIAWKQVPKPIIKDQYGTEYRQEVIDGNVKIVAVNEDANKELSKEDEKTNTKVDYPVQLVEEDIVPTHEIEKEDKEKDETPPSSSEKEEETEEKVEEPPKLPAAAKDYPTEDESSELLFL